jgi:hypothetical protein
VLELSSRIYFYQRIFIMLKKILIGAVFSIAVVGRMYASEATATAEQIEAVQTLTELTPEQQEVLAKILEEQVLTGAAQGSISEEMNAEEKKLAQQRRSRNLVTALSVTAGVLVVAALWIYHQEIAEFFGFSNKVAPGPTRSEADQQAQAEAVLRALSVEYNPQESVQFSQRWHAGETAVRAVALLNGVVTPDNGGLARDAAVEELRAACRQFFNGQDEASRSIKAKFADVLDLLGRPFEEPVVVATPLGVAGSAADDLAEKVAEMAKATKARRGRRGGVSASPAPVATRRSPRLTPVAQQPA